jgi:hypothetical protein
MLLDCFILFSIKPNQVNCGYDNESSDSIKSCGISGVAGQILANQGVLLHAASYFLTLIIYLLILFFVFRVRELKPFATLHILNLLGLVSIKICRLFSILREKKYCTKACHFYDSQINVCSCYFNLPIFHQCYRTETITLDSL